MGVWIWVWVIHVMGQDTRMKRLNSSKLNRLRQEFKKEEKKTKKKTREMQSRDYEQASSYPSYIV